MNSSVAEARMEALLDVHGYAEQVAGDTDGDTQRSEALIWVAELLLKEHSKIVRRLERRKLRQGGRS